MFGEIQDNNGEPQCNELGVFPTKGEGHVGKNSLCLPVNYNTLANHNVGKVSKSKFLVHVQGVDNLYKTSMHLADLNYWSTCQLSMINIHYLR